MLNARAGCGMFFLPRKNPKPGASHVHTTRHFPKTQKRIPTVRKSPGTQSLVRIHGHRHYRAVLIVQDVQYYSMSQNVIRFRLDKKEKVLHLHGVSEDSMEKIVADTLENDPGPFDGRALVVGLG